MVNFAEEKDEGKILRILSLDGGGAKGFYTLGVLKEIESSIETPLHQKFDLVFGTSTGAIIASLISLGYNIDSILELYRKYVPAIMSKKRAHDRSVALEALAYEVFGDAMFEDVKTGIGVVAAKWSTERPMIFKGNIMQAHGRRKSFIPGFGVSIADAVKASCSAYPFFERTIVRTSLGEEIELIDGGYCANNPTLYAIADAIKAYNIERDSIRVVNIGVGNYPEPKPKLLMRLARKYLVSIQLLQKTLEINTQSMDQLRQIMFDDVPTIRISDSYVAPEMATDLLEHDIKKLDVLFQRGRESFSSHEKELLEYLM
ncbi:patatin-like phospholipase family protein [Pectobacterium atrosepticum]|uniref:patatin-like phospholipase family protein n=1 Tax=Pectobacterium atrosepticum TaxID=29471 RepID=UPI0003A4C2DC|nr:patatin-like phospholipase family protein [Pectobacterium atrosepticum]GKV83690.1 patatin [Pectobacterium carotovorum subsp. carotovorum]AIA71039.1 patatin [Pectobacterium atrosepticum]AIK14137.1 Patatin-like phospholipase [Pectobacterium atrosepticum]ATY90954.1 patatin [Pectobacterium atrosepticum]KFX11195.1 patatin [Pectobacterium atrosepticum]